MRAGRVILVCAGVFGVLLLVAVALAFNSAVQTWAARRALANQPDVSGTIGSVSAGWKTVELRDVQLESRGVRLTMPALDAVVPVVAAGLSERVEVRSLVAKGWTLDLTRATNLPAVAAQWLESGAKKEHVAGGGGFSLVSSAYAAEAAETERVFRGLFAELRLPVDLSVDGVELEGEVILPGADEAGPVRVRVQVRGGGVAAGREGKFAVELAAPGIDGGSLGVRSTIVVAMDTPRTFTRIAADSTASASGTQIPAGVNLDIDVEATRTAEGEDYVLLLASGGKTLADVKAGLAALDSRISGTWQLDLRHTDLAPFALGRSLPEFTLVGQGGLQTEMAAQEVRGSGTLSGSVERLDMLLPELAAVGPTKFQADFDVLQHGESLRVERLDATLEGAAPVAGVKALQAFEFNLSTAELRIENPAQDLVSVSLTGLPVAWAQPFLGELRLTGGDVRGEIVASAREGGLSLRVKTPLTLSGISVASGEEALVQDVDVAIAASADYTPQGWQAQVENLDLSRAGVTLLSLDAKAGQLAGEGQPIKATGRWSADLAGWKTQPVVEGQLALASGLASGEFSASLDGIRALETKLALTNLVSLENERLPEITAEFRADVDAEGRATFSAPLVFKHEGRESDLQLSGTVTPDGERYAIDGRVTGKQVVVQDVQLLALLLPAEADEVEEAEETGAPFWGTVSGQLTLALEKVIYGEAYEVSGVAGTVKLDPGALRFEQVQAVFGPESDLNFSGGVTFDPKQEPAYRLAADVAVRNFETGPAFRAIDPAKLPTVEAAVSVTGSVTGEGRDLVQLMEGARGKFDVSSSGGVFRALATVLPADRLQAAPTALSIVGGLLGGSAGETVAAAQEIVKILSEISFDQLSFQAGRDEAMNLVLRDFSLISPAVRIRGAGQVSYDPEKPLLQQALDVQLTLAARGRLGELLGQVKLLKAEQDALGYTSFTTPIRIGGTLARTDTSDLQRRMLNLALERSGVGEAFNRILGGGKEKSEEGK
jgi:hypothetical protein